MQGVRFPVPADQGPEMWLTKPVGQRLPKYPLAKPPFAGNYQYGTKSRLFCGVKIPVQLPVSLVMGHAMKIDPAVYANPALRYFAPHPFFKELTLRRGRGNAQLWCLMRNRLRFGGLHGTGGNCGTLQFGFQPVLNMRVLLFPIKRDCRLLDPFPKLTI